MPWIACARVTRDRADHYRVESVDVVMHTGAMETVDDDLTGELVGLTRQLRAQLERHAAHGARAAPGGATPRTLVEAELDAAFEASEPGDAVPQPAADDAPRIALGVRSEPAAAPGPRPTLPQIRAELGDCKRCQLHTTRRTIVFGVGAAETPLMFVGEAPGEQEDRRGE